jgi:hypothetical protein
VFYNWFATMMVRCFGGGGEKNVLKKKYIKVLNV